MATNLKKKRDEKRYQEWFDEAVANLDDGTEAGRMAVEGFKRVASGNITSKLIKWSLARKATNGD